MTVEDHQPTACSGGCGDNSEKLPPGGSWTCGACMQAAAEHDPSRDND